MYQNRYAQCLEIIALCLKKSGIEIVPIFVKDGYVQYSGTNGNYLSPLTFKEIELLVEIM